MGRKYNYFDDDFDQPKKKFDFDKLSEKLHNHNINFDKDSIKLDKQNIENAVALAKIGSKKAKKAIKSVAKETKKIEISRKQGVISVLLIIAILILSVVITVFSTLHVINKETEKEGAFNAAAANVCATYEGKFGVCNIESLTQYGTQGYRMTGLCYARELDFDMDKNSELLICYNRGGEYFAEVWGFDGDNFSKLYENSLVQTDDVKDDAWLPIYTKDGKSYIVEHSKEDSTKATILALKGDEFKKKYVCKYDPATEIYTLKGKEEADSFERIKLSVLREYTANMLSDSVQETISRFDGKDHTAVVEQTKTDNMLSAYYDVVDNLISLYGSPELVEKDGLAYGAGVSYVDLIDFNNDDVKELLVVYRRPVVTRADDNYGNSISITVDEYFCDVYCWNGKNAWRAYQKEKLSEIANDNNQQCLIIKKGSKKSELCFNSFSYANYGRTVEGTSKIMTYNGEKFEPTFKAWYRNDYGYMSYMLDNEYVYESRFQSAGGYSVPFFNGSTDYDKNKFSVIYLQTDAQHKDRVNDLVSTTNDNIKELNKTYIPK